MKEQWCTMSDAAAELCLSEKTIRRRIADGSIRAKRFGPRMLRIDRHSLSNFGRLLQVERGEAA